MQILHNKCGVSHLKKIVVASRSLGNSYGLSRAVVKLLGRTNSIVRAAIVVISSGGGEIVGCRVADATLHAITDRGDKTAVRGAAVV